VRLRLPAQSLRSSPANRLCRITVIRAPVGGAVLCFAGFHLVFTAKLLTGGKTGDL
jgi:hypothetical protein